MAKKEVKEKNKKSYFKDFKAELKKVIWPTPKQLLNSTVAVLTIVILTVVVVFVLDVIFDAFNKNVITTLQSKVENSTSENVTSDSDTEASNTVESNTVTSESGEDTSVENQVTESNE